MQRAWIEQADYYCMIMCSLIPILILILIPIRQARRRLRFGSGRAIQGTSSVAPSDQSTNLLSGKAPGIRQFQLGLCTEPIDRQGSSLVPPSWSRVADGAKQAKCLIQNPGSGSHGSKRKNHGCRSFPGGGSSMKIHTRPRKKRGQPRHREVGRAPAWSLPWGSRCCRAGQIHGDVGFKRTEAKPARGHSCAIPRMRRTWTRTRARAPESASGHPKLQLASVQGLSLTCRLLCVPIACESETSALSSKYEPGMQGHHKSTSHPNQIHRSPLHQFKFELRQLSLLV